MTKTKKPSAPHRGELIVQFGAVVHIATDL
jgi:hypothetical protein